MNVLIPTNLRDDKGLARDAEVIASLLVDWGHAVEVFDFRGEPSSQRFDVAIHLEHVEPRHLGHAKENWYIPNAEWHMEGARNALDAGRFSRVLCKTRQAERVFSAMTDRAVFTGFECRDRFLPEVERERVFMHAPGQSGFRGTKAVCEAFEGGVPATLVFPRSMPESEYRREQNRCLFHLCTSELEGWGHTLHEALSVGAIVVTVDGPPMNEYEGVTYRIPTVRRDEFRLVERMIVDRKGVKAAIEWCLSLSAEEIARLSALAREAFEREREEFRLILAGLIERGGA